MLLLKNKVSKSSLLVNFINKSMELIEQCLLLLNQVLVLLKSNFILPLNLFKSFIIIENSFLALTKVSHDDIVFFLLALEEDNFIVSFVKWLDNLVIFIFLVRLLSSSVSVFLSVKLKSILKLVDNVKISICNFTIISSDIGVLLCVFSCELLDSEIFLFLDHFDLHFPLVIHFFSKELHLVFVFLMNFVRDSLEIVSQLGLFLVLISSQSIQVLLVSNFLFFLANLKSSEILLEFSLVDSIFIFNVLEGNLCLFLQLGELI
jgi:hypothetical protein